MAERNEVPGEQERILSSRRFHDDVGKAAKPSIVFANLMGSGQQTRNILAVLVDSSEAPSPWPI